MAVYTPLSTEEIEAFLAPYAPGRLVFAKGIAEGVENSNYLIGVEDAAAERKYILTLYEKRVKAGDLPFFLALMQHLAARGLPCPLPVAMRDGALWTTFKGRPAALVTFLPGTSCQSVQAHHVRALGKTLARMHLAAEDFSSSRDNALSLSGWETLCRTLGARLDEIEPGLAALVEDELAWLGGAWPKDLPSGVIHADLFPDNVFFEGEALTGLIDFYFACNDFFAYDLAVCVNAWCFDANGAWNETNARALVDAYDAARPLSAEERRALPALARGAALRFLLTRAHDWLHRDAGALVRVKDPLEYANKLRFFRESAIEI